MRQPAVWRRNLLPEIPDDVDDPGLIKATGTVTLPRRVNWSDTDPTYDLTCRRDQVLVYEQVMAEGTAEDVRKFIDVDVVIELWDVLMLPRAVSGAWAQWLEVHRGMIVGDWRDARDYTAV